MALMDLVVAKVKDAAGKLTEEDDFQPAIDAALEQYSGDKPKTVAADLTGAGSRDLDLPDAWVDEVSTLEAVEYPVDADPESFLASSEFKLYRKPAGLVIRLADTVTDGETVRVTITIPRTAEAHIVSGDLDAVACLAASTCCETLATIYSGTSSPTLHADVVNYRSKGAEFASRARRLRQLYTSHMGIDDDGGPTAAMAVAAPAFDPPQGLTHVRR